MNIIICGAGQVGQHTAEVLDEQGHHITVVDSSAEALRVFEESVDVRSIVGSACHASVLSEADIAKCDLVVAATDQDEINLLAATIAKKMGARKAIARIHHRAYLDRSAFDFAETMDIDHLICPEYLTALLIARNLSNPGAMAIERFAGGQIEMQRYAVASTASAAGVKLSDLQLPSGVRLATVERDGAAFIPRADTVLQGTDIVTVIGGTKQTEGVRALVQKSSAKTKAKNIIIMGGSATSVWLARALKRGNFKIRLFETDRARAEELSEKLPHVTVLQEDPTESSVFHEEHIDQADAFVAVSNNDEHNILGALQAKEFGARMTVVVVAESTYLRLLRHIDIDLPFSPRIEAAREISKLADDSPVKRMATLAERAVELYELQPVHSGSAVGKVLMDCKLPQGAIVAAIQRGSRTHVPSAKDQIRPGDILIIIGPFGLEKKLRSMFFGK